MTSIFVSTNKIAQQVYSGRVRAHQKHGENSIENKRGDEYLFWLSCLGEEFGEVDSCFTYDKDITNLRAELIDVLTVATAWVAALDND